jgi:hypothetical protein
VYDHQDKYGPLYDYGEVSKVFKQVGWHWRYTISTTMTFATTVKTLKEDLYTTWWHYTEGTHPRDHLAFLDLYQKGRRLACAIPGLAWHADLMESYRQGMLDLDTALFSYLLQDLFPRTGQPAHVFQELQARIVHGNRQGLYFEPVEALATLERLLASATSGESLGGR